MIVGLRQGRHAFDFTAFTAAFTDFALDLTLASQTGPPPNQFQHHDHAKRQRRPRSTRR